MCCKRAAPSRRLNSDSSDFCDSFDFVAGLTRGGSRGRIAKGRTSSSVISRVAYSRERQRAEDNGPNWNGWDGDDDWDSFPSHQS